MKCLIVYGEAERELWQTVDFYEARRTGLGLVFEQEVRSAFIDIQKNPSRWPKREYETRLRLLHRFLYAIHYSDSSYR